MFMFIFIGGCGGPRPFPVGPIIMCCDDGPRPFPGGPIVRCCCCCCCCCIIIIICGGGGGPLALPIGMWPPPMLCRIDSLPLPLEFIIPPCPIGGPGPGPSPDRPCMGPLRPANLGADNDGAGAWDCPRPPCPIGGGGPPRPMIGLAPRPCNRGSFDRLIVYIYIYIYVCVSSKSQY